MLIIAKERSNLAKTSLDLCASALEWELGMAAQTMDARARERARWSPRVTLCHVALHKFAAMGTNFCNSFGILTPLMHSCLPAISIFIVDERKQRQLTFSNAHLIKWRFYSLSALDSSMLVDSSGIPLQEVQIENEENQENMLKLKVLFKPHLNDQIMLLYYSAPRY